MADFEEWLRGQLEGGPATASPPRTGRPPGRSRLSAIPFGATVAGVGVLLAGGLLVLGAQIGLRDEHLAVAAAAAAPALPVTTWAGTPPPAPAKAEDRPESTAGAISDRPAATANTNPPAAVVAPVHAAQTVAPGAPPAPPPQPPPMTFAMVGGTATISCTASGPSLVSASAKPGYREEAEVEDGGSKLSVRFRSSTRESRVDAVCVAGAVQGRVAESSN